MTYYWLTATWGDKTDKNKSSESATSRITHTWLRTPTGWQILGGMSASEPGDAK